MVELTQSESEFHGTQKDFLQQDLSKFKSTHSCKLIAFTVSKKCVRKEDLIYIFIKKIIITVT